MELKKSYAGFLIWLAGYVAALLGVALLPVEDVSVLLRLIMLMTVLMMALLGWIILKTESIYWYNGVSYEEAAAAGQERRVAFARAHFRRFQVLALGCAAFTAAAQALGISGWFDFALHSVGLIAAAVSTINIKL